MESQSAASQEKALRGGDPCPSPPPEVYQQLLAHGLTDQRSAESPGEVQRKLDALQSSAGDVPLPAHVSQWLKLLLETGHALPFFEPMDLMSHMHLNSPGLLCFYSYEWMYMEEQKHVGLIDLRSESGTVAFYYMLNDDDMPCWDGPASRWVEFAKPSETFVGKFAAKKKSYPSLSDYFLEHIDAAREAQEKERTRLELTQNDTCLVIELWTMSGKKGQPSHSKSQVFTPRYENCTIAELKATVADLTGIQKEALTVKRRHMFNKFKTYLDEQLLSDCGYHAGSQVTVYVD